MSDGGREKITSRVRSTGARHRGPRQNQPTISGSLVLTYRFNLSPVERALEWWFGICDIYRSLSFSSTSLATTPPAKDTEVKRLGRGCCAFRGTPPFRVFSIPTADDHLPQFTALSPSVVSRVRIDNGFTMRLWGRGVDLSAFSTIPGPLRLILRATNLAILYLPPQCRTTSSLSFNSRPSVEVQDANRP